MRRKFPISGQEKDVDGICWDVCGVRITKHGFDLCFGIPAEDHGAYKGGTMRLIATQALQDFRIANRTRGHGFLFDLPAGRTTHKRLRSAKAGRGPQPITNSTAHPAATGSVLRAIVIQVVFRAKQSGLSLRHTSDSGQPNVDIKFRNK